MSGDAIIPPLSEWAVQGLSLCLEGFPFNYWDVITDAKIEAAREYIRNYEGAWRIIGKWEPEEVVESAPVVEVIETPVVAEVEEPAQAIAVEPTEEPVEKVLELVAMVDRFAGCRWWCVGGSSQELVNAFTPPHGSNFDPSGSALATRCRAMRKLSSSLNCFSYPAIRQASRGSSRGRISGAGLPHRSRSAESPQR